MSYSASSNDNIPWADFALGAVWLLAIYRLLVLAYGNIPLDTEEVYYLSWTDHLAWGYFSKPPLLAAVLYAVTHLFGDSVFAIKSISVVLHTAAAFAVYGLGRVLYERRTAAVAALMFQALPIVGVISMAATTDAPLMLFWTLTLLCFALALRNHAWRWWLLTGLCAGLGLMSKYTMGVLAIGLLAFLLFDREQRPLLRSPRLWAGLLLALLVWSPNLWWLAEHQYITLAHTRHISGIDKAGAHWKDLGDFLASQVAVFGPVTALAMFFWIGRRSVWRDRSSRLLLFASLPMLAVIGLQSFLSEANVNWASPTYIGLVLVATHWMLQHARRWLVASLAVNLTLVSVLYHYHSLADLAGVTLTRKTDPYFKRLGWRELGEGFKQLHERYPWAALLSSDRQLLARMAYYVRDPQRPPIRAWNPALTWGSQYDLAQNIADHPQGEFLLLSKAPEAPAVLERFTQAQLLRVIHVSIYRDLQRTLYVYRVAGFKGYRK